MSIARYATEEPCGYNGDAKRETMYIFARKGRVETM
jgi:hypothetical protein